MTFDWKVVVLVVLVGIALLLWTWKRNTPSG